MPSRTSNQTKKFYYQQIPRGVVASFDIEQDNDNLVPIVINHFKGKQVYTAEGYSFHYIRQFGRYFITEPHVYMTEYCGEYKYEVIYIAYTGVVYNLFGSDKMVTCIRAAYNMSLSFPSAASPASRLIIRDWIVFSNKYRNRSKSAVLTAFRKTHNIKTNLYSTAGIGYHAKAH